VGEGWWVKGKAEAESRKAQSAVLRLEIERAEALQTSGDASKSLALLAHQLRLMPSNRIVAGRLLSALSHRAFCLPLAPLRHHDERREKGRRVRAGEHHAVPQEEAGLVRILVRGAPRVRRGRTLSRGRSQSRSTHGRDGWRGDRPHAGWRRSSPTGLPGRGVAAPGEGRGQEEAQHTSARSPGAGTWQR